MPRFDAFCGPYNTPISPNIQSELTMNWIPERNPISVNDQGTTDKNVRCSLIRTPGLATFVNLPLSPVRCLWSGENRLFAVAGNHLYELFPSSYTDRSTPGFTGASGVGPAGGAIGNDGWPAQIFPNGNQILIISAGNAYCDSGNGPVPVQFSDPLNDLVIDPADTTGKTLNNATMNQFDASDVGRTILITGGGGFNVGLSQVIASVNSTNGAVAASAWGVPGSSLGTGIEYKARSFTDLQLVSPFQIHSPTATFGPEDIGTVLQITSGTGWTPGVYAITGLVTDSSGSPTGDAVILPAGGTAGASGGHGSINNMPVTASYGAFMDGYGFVTPNPRNKNVYFSAINDFTSWFALDFYTKANYPDNVAAIFADHQELYTFGDLESTEVMRDTGNADNTFMPDPGATMHYACQAPFSVVRLGNGVAWIGEDVRRGARRAFHAVGYNPIPVSTPAVEAAWALYHTVGDAVAFTMMDRGHELWVINFKTANATWVYDATTQWWFQWGWWNTVSDNWDRIRPWVHCVASLDGIQELHYGGDWQNGRVYVIGSNYKTDDGNVIWRRRRAPHLTTENMRRFYARFEIDCDVLGQQRIFWNRLGNGRDRIWQMDTSQSSESGGVTMYLAFTDDRTRTWQYMFSQSLDPSVDVMLANAYLNEVTATWH